MWPVVVCVILFKEGLKFVVTQTTAVLEPNISRLKIVVITDECLLYVRNCVGGPWEFKDGYTKVRPLMERRAK